MSSMHDLFKPVPEPSNELGRYRILAPGMAGLRISPLILGGMSLGTKWQSFMGSMTKEDSMKLLDRYFELGGNFIDTASNYQEGDSESFIGEWQESRGVRSQIVISTKYTMGYRTNDPSIAIKANHQGNHLKCMRNSVEDSLKRLRTDYIDILILHWWDWTTSIPEVMHGLNRLVQQGKVLYLGISDTPAWIVSACNEYAKGHGLSPFVVYQGRYSVLERDLERDILPMCRHYGMGCMTWNSVGGGKLQTKAQIEARKQAGENLRSLEGHGQTEREEKASALLEKIANELGAKSITSVALAFVMQRKQFPNVFPVVGGRKIEHLEQNTEALSITLTDEHITMLEEALPHDPGFPNNFVGDSPIYTGKPNMFLASNTKIAWPTAGGLIKPSDYKKH